MGRLGGFVFVRESMRFAPYFNSVLVLCLFLFGSVVYSQTPTDFLAGEIRIVRRFGQLITVPDYSTVEAYGVNVFGEPKFQRPFYLHLYEPTRAIPSELTAILASSMGMTPQASYLVPVRRTGGDGIPLVKDAVVPENVRATVGEDYTYTIGVLSPQMEWVNTPSSFTPRQLAVWVGYMGLAYVLGSEVGQFKRERSDLTPPRFYFYRDQLSRETHLRVLYLRYIGREAVTDAYFDHLPLNFINQLSELELNQFFYYLGAFLGRLERLDEGSFFQLYNNAINLLVDRVSPQFDAQKTKVKNRWKGNQGVLQAFNRFFNNRGYAKDILLKHSKIVEPPHLKLPKSVNWRNKSIFENAPAADVLWSIAHDWKGIGSLKGSSSHDPLTELRKRFWEESSGHFGAQPVDLYAEPPPQGLNLVGRDRRLVVVSPNDAESQYILDLCRRFQIPHYVVLDRKGEPLAQGMGLSFHHIQEITALASKSRRIDQIQLVELKPNGLEKFENRWTIVPIDHHSVEDLERNANLNRMHPWSSIHQFAVSNGVILTAREHLVGIQDRSSFQGLIFGAGISPEVAMELQPLSEELGLLLDEWKRYFQNKLTPIETTYGPLYLLRGVSLKQTFLLRVLSVLDYERKLKSSRGQSFGLSSTMSVTDDLLSFNGPVRVRDVALSFLKTEKYQLIIKGGSEDIYTYLRVKGVEAGILQRFESWVLQQVAVTRARLPSPSLTPKAVENKGMGVEGVSRYEEALGGLEGRLNSPDFEHLRFISLHPTQMGRFYLIEALSAQIEALSDETQDKKEISMALRFTLAAVSTSVDQSVLEELETKISLLRLAVKMTETKDPKLLQIAENVLELASLYNPLDRGLAQGAHEELIPIKRCALLLGKSIL